MTETEKIKKLKQAEGYYTPSAEHHNALSGCMAAWFVFVSAVALCLAGAWFWLAYTTPQTVPTPTPYPTAVPTMATPAVNPAVGQLQTVTFDTAQIAISISYPTFDGQVESREICWHTNVCSWISPPVPAGEMLTIGWWNRNDGSMFAHIGSLEVEPWQLLIEIKE